MQFSHFINVFLWRANFTSFNIDRVLASDIQGEWLTRWWLDVCVCCRRYRYCTASGWVAVKLASDDCSQKSILQRQKENKFIIISVHYVFHYVLLEQLSYNTRNQTESSIFCENSILYYTTVEVELYISVQHLYTLL